MSADKSNEELLNHLEQKAGEYVKLFGNCAQGTLLALQEQFGLGDTITLKAATAMPGVALRGENCGAVFAAIMALGMVMGREKPEDIESLQRTLGAARRLCGEFEKTYGSCNCRDIQEHLFGRNFNLADPGEKDKFVQAGGSTKCGVPAGKAARIAGEMILGYLSKSGGK